MSDETHNQVERDDNVVRSEMYWVGIEEGIEIREGREDWSVEWTTARTVWDGVLYVNI